MKLTIFTRLVIGFTVIFSMVVVAFVYSTYQLKNVNKVTKSVLEVDNRMLDLHKKLTDSFFAQLQYEKKCILLRDFSLFDRFMAAKTDFERDLRVAFLMVAPSESVNGLKIDYSGVLKKVEKNHREFTSLVIEEVNNLKSELPIPQTVNEAKKDEYTNKVIEGLKELTELGHRGTYHKIKQLDSAVYDSRSVALTMITIALVIGIFVSVIITRNITRPLSIMTKKTHDIAKGNFDVSIPLQSPPEIGELAESFNSMCTKLKEVDTMKSDFLSIMSHELRSPLASIQEGTNLLLEGIAGGISEKQKRLLTIILDADKRLLTLVNSILDLSKMEAGMMPYEFSEADIVSLIDDVIRESEPLARSRNLRIEKNMPDTLTVSHIDPERITQVLRNLLGNAVKFTPKGGYVRIASEVSEQRMKISISDNGPGIPHDELDRIFDKYQQAKFPSIGHQKGTGLGLAIVKHIITAHGGTVWAESEKGNGSTFTFSLPA